MTVFSPIPAVIGSANNATPIKTRAGIKNVKRMRRATYMLGAVCASMLIAPMVFAAPVENFGQDLSGLKQAFANNQVHILQLGDSHTAGDYFTEQLRKRLQAEVGDGGLGFAYPMAVRGQRVARHGYDVGGFTLNNSRFDSNVDYPLGGMVASPNNSSSYLTVTSQYYKGDEQNARIIVKGNAGQSVRVSDSNGIRSLPLSNNGWQTVNTTMVFPSTIQADPNIDIGGFWLNRARGGTVSAMGINGATQDYWQRWHPQLEQDLAQSRADLVILAYGTNEAFQNNVYNQKQVTKQAIAKIRSGLPNASILVMGAPESLKRTAGSCGVRAPSLDSVQSQLRAAAAESGTLYWSWEEAMGGRCSMKGWIAQGLGRSDGVHFSRSGYERAANDLYTNLKGLLATGGQYAPVINSTSSVPNYGSSLNDYSSKTIRLEKSNNNTITITNVPKGSAKICNPKTGKCVSQ